jgi:hypothetical protein
MIRGAGRKGRGDGAGRGRRRRGEGGHVEARRAARREAMEAALAAGVPYEEAEPEGPPPTPAERMRKLLRRFLSLWHAFDNLPPVRWLKRMIPFPIGERFAVISITAAIWNPRVTFVALLAWGAFAALYTGLGRILRSLAR